MVDFTTIFYVFIGFAVGFAVGKFFVPLVQATRIFGKEMHNTLDTDKKRLDEVKY